ncbi:hypothetical protein GCK72_005717 [Caenorhabditis remanei]|uniref:Uncharacterized protein n=1 Tax=Caenorhabditis remanei TaxID=31234 RepID=A0A6A5HGB1_CAERE|nr:hypothetical protein GCK72_005717 [Caenorhabditis remanei]KAF1765764.1 hypothetical protein GCK72_005717 [Caenorhabditis remanei]
MKEMKWYLINMACWTRAMDLMYSLFVIPYFFIPTLVVLPVGVFSLIGVPTQIQLVMLVIIITAEMCRLYLLFLLFLSTSASDFFDFDWDSPYESTEDVRYLGRDDGRTPSERGAHEPSTQYLMHERFKEDMLAVLQKRSRAHFDDLARYFNSKIQIQSCFASGKNLNADQLYQLMIHLSAYYRVWSNVEFETRDLAGPKYAFAIMRHNATIHDGSQIAGKWKYEASFYRGWNSFLIDHLTFVGSCRGIPQTAPQDPLEDPDHFVERVRTKLVSDLFLPYGYFKKLENFEDFGDWITEAAQFVVCDEPKMNKKEFIKFMAERYHGIRRYSDNVFNYTKNQQNIEITFSTTWEAPNTTLYRDTYTFRVKKEEDYVPQLDNSFSYWRIYWVTKKCTVDRTRHPAILDGANNLMEVNKRFCGMIDGENWDVFQSFLDLFDPKDTIWGACVGARDLGYDKIREHMEKVAMRYAKCVVTRVNIRNLIRAEFATTFTMSRATDIQEQEEVDVGFSGFKDKDGYWRMNRMYFLCDETTQKRKFIEL